MHQVVASDLFLFYRTHITLVNSTSATIYNSISSSQRLTSLLVFEITISHMAFPEYSFIYMWTCFTKTSKEKVEDSRAKPNVYKNLRILHTINRDIHEKINQYTDIHN